MLAMAHCEYELTEYVLNENAEYENDEYSAVGSHFEDHFVEIRTFASQSLSRHLHLLTEH